MNPASAFWLTDKQLQERGLLGFRCPWCERAVVGRTPKGCEPTEWRWVPWLHRPEKYCCCGCFLDFDAACVSVRFEAHPDREAVELAASKEGMTAQEFRLLFLRQMLVDVAENNGLSERLREKYTDEVHAALRSMGQQ